MIFYPLYFIDSQEKLLDLLVCVILFLLFMINVSSVVVCPAMHYIHAL